MLLPHIGTPRQFSASRSLRCFVSDLPFRWLIALRIRAFSHGHFPCRKGTLEIPKPDKLQAACVSISVSSLVALRLSGKSARSRSRDGSSSVPRRGADLLQLYFHHAPADRHYFGEYPLDS